MLVARNGRIHTATPRARRWLAERFGVRRDARSLPRALREWLRGSRGNGGQCRPFVDQNERSQLVLSLLHGEADGAFTILLQERRTGTAPPRSRYLGLTRRQGEVHALLKQGMKNSEIAQALGIGEATAKRHVEDVLSRLHVRNRAAAAAVQ